MDGEALGPVRSGDDAWIGVALGIAVGTGEGCTEGPLGVEVID